MTESRYAFNYLSMQEGLQSQQQIHKLVDERRSVVNKLVDEVAAAIIDTLMCRHIVSDKQLYRVVRK